MTITVQLNALTGFVTYADVPPFRPMPSVVFWGDRTFMRTGRKWVWRGFRFVPLYSEVFVAAIVDQQTPRDRLAGGALMVETAARRSPGATEPTAIYQLGNRGIGA